MKAVMSNNGDMNSILLLSPPKRTEKTLMKIVIA